MYTHNFDFTVASQFIRGELEFTESGEVLYKIEQTSDPLKNEFVSLFNDMIDYMEQINKLGALKKMKVVLK